MNNMYDILAKINLLEGKGSRPDFLDLDRDGDRSEPMKKAAKEVDEGSTGDYSARKARAGKDIGKPGKQFSKISADAAKRYGSKERGEKVAGAVLAKLRKEGVGEARNPQALDYQEGPEDDEEYRRHHGLDDPDRQRERQLRATDYKTLDRLERQAVDRAKQIDEEPNEGNEFSGELAKAKATGAKEFKVDGKTYPVRESSKADIRLVKEHASGNRSIKIYHDRAYDEFTICMAQGETVTRVFAENQQQAVAYAKTWLSEGRNDPSPLDDPLTRFRKKHAPSVMKDPAGREELAKLDTEYGERRKTGYGRGEDEDDEGEDDGKKKAKPAGEKRGRGRPKGTRRAIGAKGPTGRSKLLTREQGVEEDYDRDEYDEEGEMAQSQARTIEDAARELQAIVDADENLPEWVQKKITLAMDYIDTARDYLIANRPDQDMEESALQAHIGKKKYGDSGMKALQKAGREGASKEKMARIRAQHDKLDEVDLDEKAVSKSQRRAAGIAHAAKKGEIPKSELRGASKEMAKMSGSELKKFAKTKEKGLPEKKKEESVEETTTAGNVAPAADTPKGGKKGGIQFGKGIYENQLQESFSLKLAQILKEGTTITINDPDAGEPSISVNATGGDAAGLGELLKLAGMFSSSGYTRMDGQDTCSVCGGAGMHEAGCSREVMEEDLANSADNTTTMDTNYMTQELAGGLNGPKRQINPNNPADNPLAMPDLAKAPSGQLNLGAVAEEIQQERENHLVELYKRIA